ncbi:hypothetical protein H7J77_17115 [Mycolicibacillus parakoreensis]|uniref:Scaffolding protein n=1 Tax=Mycolicibacillus parakoreensis TaxID=1069221 RepID=A0ABY3TYV7_9MYCO|nr:hypothetical protein [Mycolicibacillus parakoreensis]MCV7317257.1 hypothetical protein [Mycolicibacillus parakoreensis]ULN51531.1 hypothetical protein MIU77_11495 [Mycolicibacillus parakoreensis]
MTAAKHDEQPTDEQTPETEGKDTREDTKPASEAEKGQSEDKSTSANREAAGYRRRLRDVEAERDELAASLNTLRKAEIERLAGEHLRVGSAIWASGTDLESLLTEDGGIDAEAVKAAAVAARDELGLEANTPRNYVPTEGQHVERPGPSALDRMTAAVMGADID